VRLVFSRRWRWSSLTIFRSHRPRLIARLAAAPLRIRRDLARWLPVAQGHRRSRAERRPAGFTRVFDFHWACWSGHAAGRLG
jgi:hypothetical protein